MRINTISRSMVRASEPLAMAAARSTSLVARTTTAIPTMADPTRRQWPRESGCKPQAHRRAAMTSGTYVVTTECVGVATFDRALLGEERLDQLGNLREPGRRNWPEVVR